MQKSDAQQFVLDELMLVCAIPIAADRLAVLCHGQRAAAEGVYISQVLTVDHAGKWSDVGRFRWQGVDLTVRPHSGELLVLGRDGQIGSIFAGRSATESWLEQGRAMGPMRGISAFGSTGVAFGMNRHVYVTDDGMVWRRFEAGFEPEDDGGEIDFDHLLDDLGGINAIARTRSNEFLAVGMKGEIWRTATAKDAWIRQEAATNIGLSAVFVTEDGLEMAVGQVGVILANSGAGWAEVPYTGPQRLDFTDAVPFSDSVLLADGHTLRRLRDGVLDLVDVGTPQLMPCAKLATGFDQVVGCAPKELYFSLDGVSWTLLL